MSFSGRTGDAHDEGRAGITIEESTDLASLRALAVANGLDEGDLLEDRRMVAWAARTNAGHLVGAILLADGPDLPLIHWLVVEEPYRRRKVATRLLARLEDEARRRKLPRLWTTARAPDFFFANGFDEVSDGPEARLLLSDCLACRQYRHGCEPKAMVKRLDLPGPALSRDGES